MKTIYSITCRTFILAFSFFYSAFIFADTFSICAVDSATGQVGSAGATCITSASTGAIIISDVHPGVGVIHTQAYWYAANQNYGRTLMNLGILSPQQIIDSLTAHDVQNNPTKRQYGIVDLVGGGRSAAYTGTNCDPYKNHITGSYYSIQGNTLLGQQILDSMESRFLNTQGTLACRLMAALQGAKVVGADTRCDTFGISSFSAFIRVANPGDNVNALYLDKRVNTYPNHIDPIDSLQVLFNNWGGCLVTSVSSLPGKFTIKSFPNPVSEVVTIVTNNFSGTIKLVNPLGEIIKTIQVTNKRESFLNVVDLTKGIYFLKGTDENGESFSSRLIKE